MTGKEATTLLREMIRIRAAEETVAKYYPEQEMRTPTHFSIGQEAVSVGVCQALEVTDAAYSGLSTNTPLSVRQPKGHQIWKWAAGYNIASALVDGNDVFAVHDAATTAVAHIRSGQGPYFLEATYFRARVHVGYETDAMKHY